MTKSLSTKGAKPSASASPSTDPSTPSGTGKLVLSPDLEVTLFSRLLALHGPTLRRMLRVQYRFNSKICAFPSPELYDGELVPDSSVEGRKLSDLDGVDEDEDLDEPVVFIDSASSRSLLLSQRETYAGDTAQLRARRCTSARPRTARSGPNPRATRTRQSASCRSCAVLRTEPIVDSLVRLLSRRRIVRQYVESLVRLPPSSFPEPPEPPP